MNSKSFAVSSARVAMCLLALALCGCQRPFYAAQGRIGSHGGPLGHWSLSPDGCSLAPFDGLPVGKSHSLVEFAWRHGRPVHWSKDGPPDRWEQGPATFDLAQETGGITGSLRLVQTEDPVQFDHSNCARLRLETHPGPPVIAGGPASLGGHLVMDCTAQGSHITANLTFRGCVR